MRLASQRRIRLLLVAGLVGAFFGCGQEEAPPDDANTGPILSGGERVFVRHILIQYAGAYGAPLDIVRSRSSADSLARGIRDSVVAGADFEALARQHSDDASAEDGGRIAPLQPGDAPPVFLRTAASLEPGELSEVFETPYGFHLIERRDMSPCAAQHILVQYKGAQDAPDTLTRTRDEALARIERIHAELQNPDVSFPVAAREYTDDPQTRPKGGFLGAFRRGKMDPAFETAAFALRENEISEIIETPFGFHVIRRVPDVRIRVAHILIAYTGTGELVGGQRTREEALQRAFDVAFRAREGEDFAMLAREFSDDGFTRERGGRMPLLRHGQAVPEFETVAFDLKPGEVSDVVETHFGFHVIRRLY